MLIAGGIADANWPTKLDDNKRTKTKNAKIAVDLLSKSNAKLCQLSNVKEDPWGTDNQAKILHGFVPRKWGDLPQVLARGAHFLTPKKPIQPSVSLSMSCPLWYIFIPYCPT